MDTGDDTFEVVCGVEDRTVRFGNPCGSGQQLARNRFTLGNSNLFQFCKKLYSRFRPNRPVAEETAFDLNFMLITVFILEDIGCQEVYNDVVIVTAV